MTINLNIKRTVLQQANEYFRIGEFHESIKWYELALKENPVFKRFIDQNIAIANRRVSHLKNIKLQLAPLIRAESEKYKIDSTIPGADLAIIILNLNGAHLLENLFDSLTLHQPTIKYNIYITDHNSNDDSEEVISRLSKSLPIRAHFSRKNHSFSASNNAWLLHSRNEQKLLFLNNDIVFMANEIDRMFHTLNNKSIGVVGIDQLEMLQNGIQEWHHKGIGVRWDSEYEFWRPFNSKSNLHVCYGEYSENIAITGSVMAVRRQDFAYLGGFDESYFYGYEDVDLCIKYKRLIGKSCVSLKSKSVIHADGATRNKVDEHKTKTQRLKNIEIFKKRHTLYLSSLYKRTCTTENPISLSQPHLAFAVTEVGEHASAGDYFTAIEMGNAIQKMLGWRVSYIPKDEWINLANIDIIVAMTDNYDPSKIVQRHPALILVAWARNWFNRWCERPWADLYDVYFASSETGAAYINKQLGIQSRILRIATNPDRFESTKEASEKSLDFCFTGSYWNAEREIVEALGKLPARFRGAIYGKNWEKVHKVVHLHKGFVPYSDIPKIYKKTLIVIDDANHVTKPWGSTNSRVFDGIAAGCIVITNSKESSLDSFDGKLPTYSSPDELIKLIDQYITDKELATTKLNELSDWVKQHHTYSQRAIQLKKHLTDALEKQLRFTIKVPCPNREVAQQWGDFHFANSLCWHLRAAGHRSRIEFLNEWNNHELLEFGDEVSLTLRGLSPYTPSDKHINLLWIISHPNKIALEEVNQFDHAFIASSAFQSAFSKLTKTPTSVLLQCTDSRFFNPFNPVAIATPFHDVVFVGNSRSQFRTSIKYSLEYNLRPSVYGAKWEGIIPDELIINENIPNQRISNYYKNSMAILNDHWEDMRENGFVSNRVFDVIACGKSIITDNCDGILELFPNSAKIYESAEELFKQVTKSKLNSIADDVEVGEILSVHTFHNRSQLIARTAESLINEGSLHVNVKP